jgi:hypothetical protein
MKSKPLWKPVLLVFVASVVGYALVYGWIEHRRVRQGPWQITFTTTTNGAALLVINQPAVGITNVQIIFPGNSPALTNAAAVLTFADARVVPFDLPFGQCIFQDTTFLPGTVALNSYGHEIQLLPRVLTVDRVERPWRTGETITLEAPAQGTNSN